MAQPAHMPTRDPLWPLVAAMCDGTITPDELARLEAVLRADEAARLFYAAYMDLHGRLLWRFREGAEGRSRTPEVGAEKSSTEVDPSSIIPHPSDAPRQESFAHPIIIDTGGPLDAPWFDVHSSLGGWLFSYAVATVLTGAAILGAWVYKVSYDDRVAVADNNPGITVSGGRTEETVPPAHFVGRVTGLADAKWPEQRDFPPPSANASVPLGRNYQLDSGLMEITYDTGAKVILQGPCVYDVDSPAGGFLSLGKLTARVERSGVRGQGSEIRNQKSEISNPQSPIPNPLFVVRTPTAVVTDLGTEFGVEVDKQGRVTAHVLQGKVEVRASFCSPTGEEVAVDGAGHPIQLVAGESVRVLKGTEGQGLTMVRGAADAATFAARPGHLAEFAEEQRRKPFRRWHAYSQELRKDPSLVTYYTFESRGRDPTRDQSILPNVAATGEVLDGRIDGPRWAEGRFPGKFALRFYGSGSNDHVELPEPERLHFTGAFTVAVWFKNAPPSADFPMSFVRTLAAKGDLDWRIQEVGKGCRLVVFDTGGSPGPDFHGQPAKTSCQDDRWHLAVGVLEPGRQGASKRLYIDGRLEAESDNVPQPAPAANDPPVWLGNNRGMPDRGHQGLIDEVAILSRALTGREVLEMFNAGDPYAAPQLEGR